MKICAYCRPCAGAVAQVSGAFKLFRAEFKVTVLARLQFCNAGLVDAEANGCSLFAEFSGQLEIDVTQALIAMVL